MVEEGMKKLLSCALGGDPFTPFFSPAAAAHSPPKKPLIGVAQILHSKIQCLCRCRKINESLDTCIKMMPTKRSLFHSAIVQNHRIARYIYQN